MSESTEAAIDEIISTCDGDLRGALKALVIINEQLEAELQHMYARAAHGAGRRSDHDLLH